MKYSSCIAELLNNEQDLNHQHDINRLILQLNKSKSPKELYELVREVSDSIINSNENKTINKMKEETYGYGEDLVFENVGESNLRLTIATEFRYYTQTNETKIIAEARIKSKDGITEIGSGTYKECYDLCVTKKLELEPKVYNWENCFSRKGYYICDEGKINGYIPDSNNIRDCHKKIYPTKADADSALAYCQLLHVVDAINEDYPRGSENEHYYQVAYDTINNKLRVYICPTIRINIGCLKFSSEEGADMLIRYNEELLKTYFKIK